MIGALRALVLCSLVTVTLGVTGLSAFGGQNPPVPPPPGPPPAVEQKPAAPVERLGPDRLRIGNILIDTATKEISVGGVVNDVSTLEFLANTKGGLKGYESALELDTNAVNFNLALILIGLDPSHGTVPKFQFDPQSPKGDPVEIWVEWDEAGKRRRHRAEEIVYDGQSKRTLDEGPWVYTGSAFSQGTNSFLAETDGTLIGFMHNPSPIIESPRPLLGSYGEIRVNPTLGLKPGTRVEVTVKSLGTGRN